MAQELSACLSKFHRAPLANKGGLFSLSLPGVHGAVPHELNKLVTATDESPLLIPPKGQGNQLEPPRNNKTASIIISGKGGSGLLDKASESGTAYISAVRAKVRATNRQ